MTYEENFGGEGPFNHVGEKFLDIEGGVGFVSPSDSGNPEYGIIVGFSDKANSDFEDL